MIRVTIERPEAALDAQWEAIAPHANNVFMHPTALKAASGTLFAMIYVLLAWDTAVEPNKLVGWWALQGKHLLLWPYLETLPFNYAFLSTPVLDPEHAAEVMPAFMAAIARDKALPSTLMVRDFDAAGAAWTAIETSGLPASPLKTDQRPFATRESGLKRTGSTRKKLRQDWNRLAGTGTLDVVNVREPGAVPDAFEAFLEMEAAGWKGAGGTALLSDPHDASFARRLIGDMSARGDASVALLRLDGKPIAAQVLLYAGRTAYTWKTSYDTEHAKFSPGTLLVDKVSMDLLDTDTVDAIDSCAIGEGFMASLWSGRKPMVDMVFSASPRPAMSFYALTAYRRARDAAKAWRNRLMKRSHAAPKAATAPAATPTVETPAGPFAETPGGPAVSGPGSKAGRAA